MLTRRTRRSRCWTARFLNRPEISRYMMMGEVALNSGNRSWGDVSSSSLDLDSRTDRLVQNLFRRDFAAQSLGEIDAFRDQHGVERDFSGWK